MGSLVLFFFSFFFLIVNSFFWSWYSEEVLREATLVGPGGSILGPEPVRSALGLGHGDGGEERFRFLGNSSDRPPGFATLRENSREELWFGSQKSCRVSVWLNLLAAKKP